MAAPANAPVANHLYPVAYGIDDLGQLIERSAAAVQLPAAVVRYHDRVRADIRRPPGVGGLGGHSGPPMY